MPIVRVRVWVRVRVRVWVTLLALVVITKCNIWSDWHKIYKYNYNRCLDC